MKLSLNVFGFEIANLRLDIDAPTPGPVVTAAENVLNKGVKGISGIWVKRMMSRS